MSEEGEIWAEHRKERQEKRWKNRDWSITFLVKQGIKVQCLSEPIGHYKVGDFSFWPTTGKYYNPKTGKSGRGVKNLVRELKK